MKKELNELLESLDDTILRTENLMNQHQPDSEEYKDFAEMVKGLEKHRNLLISYIVVL